ncbi:MAG: hypothetical protein FJZ58_06050 [Chlamydiae bacterium]|nr:hypothetical protein [Chlamydiota bacterium]
MTLDARRLNKYHPRRSSKEMQVHRQALKDLEHKLTTDLGELLILAKEGSRERVFEVSSKTKADLLKFGPEMQKIAAEIGAPFPKMVKDFLHHIDTLLHWQEKESSSPFFLWVDDAKIRSCYLSTERLERALLK